MKNKLLVLCAMLTISITPALAITATSSFLTSGGSSSLGKGDSDQTAAKPSDPRMSEENDIFAEQDKYDPLEQTSDNQDDIFNPMNDKLLALRNAIIGRESNGNPQAVNGRTSCLGLGQIHPDNIGPWSKEALGYSVDYATLKYRPDLQLQIIDHKLNQYLQNNLNAGYDFDTAVLRTAASWYGGPGNAGLYNSTRGQGPRGNEPSFYNYTHNVLSRFYTQLNNIRSG